MTRARSLLPLALILAGAAQAQQTLEAVRMPTPLRSAGIYHVASGTWSRTGATAHIGSDVIYNASAPSGYFGTGWQEEEVVDEGLLPGPTNTTFAGPQDQYRIDGFEFAYCSMADTIGWTLTFYDSYVPCDLPSNPAGCLSTAGSVTVTDFPTADACWVVTIDLTGGQELCIEADGGPCAAGYDGAGSDLDHFGWSPVWTTGDWGWSGPVVAGGDPNWAPHGEGTCYLPSLTCPAGATGAGALDMFACDFGFGPGCCWFGGYDHDTGCGTPHKGRFAQFHLRLFTDCTTTCGVPIPYCDTHPAQLGDLTISTTQVAAAPVLTASGLVGGLFAMHLVGNGNDVVVDPPGALGEFCLGGSTPGIGRYVADMGPVVGESFSTDLVHGPTGGGAGHLPNPPGGVLTPGDTWNFQTWTRVTGSSRFSSALRVTFE